MSEWLFGPVSWLAFAGVLWWVATEVRRDLKRDIEELGEEIRRVDECITDTQSMLSGVEKRLAHVERERGIETTFDQ